MHLKPFMAASVVALSALSFGAFGSANAENGHGFNCTPGNPGRAEAVHTLHGKDDQGNGEDCPTSVTTVIAPTVSPSGVNSAGAQVAGATATRTSPRAVTAPAAVKVAPHLTG